MQRTPSSPPDIDGYVVDRLIGSAGAVPPHRAKKRGSARGLSDPLLRTGFVSLPDDYQGSLPITPSNIAALYRAKYQDSGSRVPAEMQVLRTISFKSESRIAFASRWGRLAARSNTEITSGWLNSQSREST